MSVMLEQLLNFTYLESMEKLQIYLNFRSVIVQSRDSNILIIDNYLCERFLP